MGHEVTPRADNPWTRYRFGKQLRWETRTWLPTLLASGGPVIPGTGCELELGFFKQFDLTPAHELGPLVLAALQEIFGDEITPELVNANGEMVVDHRPLASATPFGDMADDLGRKLETGKRLAHAHRLLLGLFGCPPSWCDAFATYYPELMVQMRRYLTYVRRMPKLRLELQGVNHPIQVLADTVVGIGSCHAFQFTLDVPPGQLHDFYDAAMIWAALQRALFPNAPFIWGQEAMADDVRWDVFRAATTVDGRERTFVGPGWNESEMDVFHGILRQVDHRSIFLDADRSTPGSAWMRLLSSTFPAARPRKAEDGHWFLEFRVGSAGLTVEQMVCQAALGIAVVTHLANRIKSWREHVSFAEIKRNLNRAAYGPESQLTWQDNGTVGQKAAIDILAGLISGAYHVLVDDYGVGELDATRALDPAHRLLCTGQTGASVQRDTYRALRGMRATHEEALRLTTAACVLTSREGTSREPVADWSARAMARAA